MFLKNIVILFVSVLLLTFYSCSDNPSSVGKEILNPNLTIKQINSYTDSLQQSSSSEKKVIKLDPSERNLIGKYNNVEASTLISFFILLPDSIENDFASGNSNIVSATAELYNTYTLGDSSAPYDFTVHKINSSWTFKSFTADSLAALLYDQANSASNINFTDSITTFRIDNNLVKQWFQRVVDSSQSSNMGVYIKPTLSTRKVIGYQALSLSSSNLPRLKVIVEKPGSYTDTLSFLAGSDISVVTGNLPNINPEDLVVQGGLTAQSNIKFDVSSIPKTAVINNASLTLYADSVETKIGKGSVNSLDAGLASADTSLFSIKLSKNGNTYTGNITFFVERWVQNKNKNEGIILKADDRINNVDLFAIKGSNASNLTLRPRLTITYSNN